MALDKDDLWQCFDPSTDTKRTNALHWTAKVIAQQTFTAEVVAVAARQPIPLIVLRSTRYLMPAASR
jgi:hypothetical protein